jgi:hypothetical protein
MRILCTGCSWTDVWPNHLPDSINFHKASLHGAGLGNLHKLLVEKGSDKREFASKFGMIICQLPTPIRSHEGADTTDKHKKFVDSFGDKDDEENYLEEVAKEKLLTEYKNKILEMNKLHPEIVFFLYNTGGYPLRHPFDFGEDVDEKLIEFFKENNLKHIYLSFEGVPGYCKQEEDCDDLEYKDFVEKNMKRVLKIKSIYRNRMNEDYWVWQHPENRIIYDPHPSKRADKIAAKTVRKYIDEKY